MYCRDSAGASVSLLAEAQVWVTAVLLLGGEWVPLQVATMSSEQREWSCFAH